MAWGTPRMPQANVYSLVQQLLSAVFFSSLDIADFALCFVFAGLDTLFGHKWGPCYCRPREKAHCERPLTRSERGKIIQKPANECGWPSGFPGDSDPLQRAGGSELECVLYSQSRIVSLRRRILSIGRCSVTLPASSSFSIIEQSLRSNPGSTEVLSSTPTTVPLLPGSHSLPQLSSSPQAAEELRSLPIRRAVSAIDSQPWRGGLRWSDCSCPDCSEPESGPGQCLYVHIPHNDATNIDAQQGSGRSYNTTPGRRQNQEKEPELFLPINRQANVGSTESAVYRPAPPSQGAGDVIFLHGFCSSSCFWADTVVPAFSRSFLEFHRLLLVDLLGWGRSPKPRDCKYTVGEHVVRIEEDVIRRLHVRQFHLVAHSMGCVVALALAARNPGAVLSVTLFSPPSAPEVEACSSSGLDFFRLSAPKVLCPAMALPISIMAWYEHVGRLMCAVFTKGHPIWEAIAEPLLRHLRVVPTSFLRDFMRHTHHSAWHCYYNTICQGASMYPVLLKSLGNQKVTIVHGVEDTLCPIDASRQLARMHANVQLKEVPLEDHVTVVLGRESIAAKLIEDEVRTVTLEAT